MSSTSLFLLILLVTGRIGAASGAETTTRVCPAVCPSGWVKFPASGTDHCYLLPPKPVPLTTFWDYQNYCASQQPTSYILEINSALEDAAASLQVAKYLLQYVQAKGDFWAWIGAYYQNGSWHWLNGDPWSFNGIVPKVTDPPTNGSCVYYDPKITAWSYRDCSETQGAAACEMSPIVDCSATFPVTTTRGPYMPPDCQQSAWADYTKHATTGYLGVGGESELAWLPNMDTTSCSVACMYYSGCFSFDIDSTTGDCRLLQASSQLTCTFVDDPTGVWQHYDMVAGSTYASY